MIPVIIKSGRLVADLSVYMNIQAVEKNGFYMLVGTGVETNGVQVICEILTPNEIGDTMSTEDGIMDIVMENIFDAMRNEEMTCDLSEYTKEISPRLMKFIKTQKPNLWEGTFTKPMEGGN